MYVSEKLDAGTVFINTYNKTDVAAPFGGVKQSGFGKDLGTPLLCPLRVPFVTQHGEVRCASRATRVPCGRASPTWQLDRS